MPDIVVVTETRVDVVTVTGSGTTDTIQVIGDKQIEVLTMGVQGPQGPGSVLSPATTTTLGGVIVGDNLSINANGLLSAQAGGVTAFNGRAGNVSLTATDVSSVAGGLYFPLNGNVTCGIVSAPASVQVNTYSSPNETRTIYGELKSYFVGTTQFTQYIGMQPGVTSSDQSVVFGSRYYETEPTFQNPSAGWRQAELTMASGAIGLRSTLRYANGTAQRDMGFSSNILGMNFYFNDPQIQCSIAASSIGIQLNGKSRAPLPAGSSASVPSSIDPMQIMNKDTCDKLYAPFQKLN